MRILVRCFGLALGVFLLASPVTNARAADYCLHAGTGTIVLKAFSLPGKGVCKDARGFFLLSDEPWWLNGMACGSSDGAHVTFTQLVHLPDLVESFAYTLNRASSTGSLRQCVLDTGNGGSCVSGIAVSETPCNPTKVPVP